MKAICCGRPMGTLNTSLTKSYTDIQHHARKIFDLFKVFLTKQFKELGFNKEAEQHAMHILARSQGISVVAHAYGDIKFLKRETNTLDQYARPMVRATNE